MPESRTGYLAIAQRLDGGKRVSIPRAHPAIVAKKAKRKSKKAAKKKAYYSGRKEKKAKK